MASPTTAPSSMPRAAPTVGSAAPCNTGCATGNGGSISRRKASRMTAGASSRHRGWRASTAISAGRAPMPRFIWSRPQRTISSARSDRHQSNCSPNDYRAIYTWPQTTKNQAELIALNGRYSVPDHGRVQSNLYYRRFDQQHADANAAEVERCSGTTTNPLFNTLCLENDAFPQPRPPQAAFQILNQNGQPIPCPPGGGNTCATTPWGTVDRTFTKGLTTGASLQALGDDKVFGHDNNFVIGASVDRSKIGFRGSSELGVISPDLFVGPNAAAPPPISALARSASLRGRPITYYGAYFNETFDLTNRLSLTAGGRYNLAA